MVHYHPSSGQLNVSFTDNSAFHTETDTSCTQAEDIIGCGVTIKLLAPSLVMQNFSNTTLLIILSGGLIAQSLRVAELFGVFNADNLMILSIVS